MIFLLSGVLALAAVAAAWLTGRVRRYALARQLLDLPNARSLHATPVARGGGLALVPVVLACLVLGSALGLDGWGPMAVTVAGSSVLAGLGWCDDRSPLGAGLRLRVQFCVAALCVLALWGLGDAADARVWWLPFAVPAIVWFINLYNFMDGSDGMAGSQGLAGGLGLCGLGLIAGMPGVAVGGAALAGACLGFLYWNWSPARIFLGDVGSYFLGGLFALLVARALVAGQAPLPWLLLFVPFVTDTTLTLFARMSRGGRWWEPHRDHAYQRLVLRGWSHRSVALAYAGFSAGLWPLAWRALAQPEDAVPLALLAYGLAVTMWLLVRLGRQRAKPP